jgi:tether containing UBX domain for GLUT4
LELEANFLPSETPKSLIEFVKKHLAEPDIPFYLYTTPPPTRINPNVSFADQQLVPAAVVLFALEKGFNNKIIRTGTFSTHQSNPTQTTDAKQTVASFLKLEFIPQSQSQPVVPRQPPPAKESEQEKSKKIVPKWFAAGKKK